MILDWIKSVFKSKNDLFRETEKHAPEEVGGYHVSRLDAAMRELEAAARRAGVTNGEMEELKRRVRESVDPLRAMSEERQKRGKHK